MNNHAVPTESEAIKHNMEDTHAVGFHFSLRYDYGVPVKSNLLRESVCVRASVCMCSRPAYLTHSSPGSSSRCLSLIPIL